MNITHHMMHFALVFDRLCDQDSSPPERPLYSVVSRHHIMKGDRLKKPDWPGFSRDRVRKG